MASGAPKFVYKEFDLTDIVPSFSGVTAAAVIDCARGSVEDEILIGSTDELVAKTGKPNPRKFGIGWHSCYNFLQKGGTLKLRRVDKGQTYATALVRTKVAATVDLDPYGYPLDKPSVDPIVKPLSPMSKTDILSYVFSVYPTAREVTQYVPGISLTRKPKNDDTEIYVDNNAPANVNDYITFVDTTGMPQDQARNYKLYQVVGKDRVQITQFYLKIAGNVNSVTPGATIQGTNTYYLGTTVPCTTAIPAPVGATAMYFSSLDPIIGAGSVLSFNDNNSNIAVVNSVSSEDVTMSFATPITVTGLDGSLLVSSQDAIGQVASNRLYVDGNTYNVVSVDTINGNIVLGSPLLSKFTVSNTPAVVGVPEAYDVDVVGAIVTGNTYTLSINGTNYNVTTTSQDDATSVAQLIASAIISDANAEFTATAVGSKISIVANNTATHTVSASPEFQLTKLANATPATNQVVSLTPRVLNNTKYIIDLGGSARYTYTSGAGATASTICSGLAGLLSGVQGISVSASTKLDITNLGSTPITVRTYTDSSASKVVNLSKVLLTTSLSTAVSPGIVAKRQVVQTGEFAQQVKILGIAPGTSDVIEVNDNDPIAEGDIITINGLQFAVTEKYDRYNFVNRLILDTGYVDQSGSGVGSPVYHAARTDSEQRDAFLIYAASPGIDGEDIACTIRSSSNYENAFNIDVYYVGIQVETFEVSRTHQLDGYGRQMNLEEVINNQSQYIRVKDNPLMVDESDNPTLPLSTLYYVRQPVSIANYSPVATIQESVFDGDNLIRVNVSDIGNIDINKPVKIGTSTYNIASMTSSIVGGPIDTIVLATVVKLGLDNLPPDQRKLSLGSPVSQYLTRTKITNVTVGATTGSFSIDLKGTTTVRFSTNYSYTAIAGDTVDSIAHALSDVVNADTAARVTATAVPGGMVRLTSKVSGVDFALVLSSNLSESVVQTNARSFTNYLTEKIQGSVLPAVRLGSTVELSNGNYNILDSGANSLVGGDDAGHPTVGQYLIALDKFSDRENTDFLVLMSAGVTATAYQQRMIEIAESRKDCIALLASDYTAHVNPDINKVIKWRVDLGANSSFAAIYPSWMKVYDKFNDVEVHIPGDSFAAGALSHASSNGELWESTGGYDHGRLLTLGPVRPYSSAELDVLYNNQLNPVRVKASAIWGQKTSMTRPSTLSRVNVRMVMILVFRGLSSYLETVEFKLNTAFTQGRVDRAIRSFLQDIKVRGGIQNFDVRCDSGNNTEYVVSNNELLVDVLVQPTQVIEWITARVGITNSGSVSIKDVQFSN